MKKEVILFRDFIERHQIKNVELARVLHSFTIQNFTNEISVNALFNRVKSMGVRVSKNLLMITWEQEGEMEKGEKRIKLTQLWKWLTEQ